MRIETLLKTVMTPADSTEGLVGSYMHLIGDRSFSNFQKILDLKGIRKVEQNAIMDAFVAMTSQNAELEDSSFLTTLDMDTANLPSQPPSQAGFFSFAGPDLPGTPPASSTQRFPGLALGASDKTPGSVQSGGEVAAQRAFNDLRRFGSMLVGRREPSDGRSR